jgi:hypothetical protein
MAMNAARLIHPAVCQLLDHIERKNEFIKGLTVYHIGHQYPIRLESNYNAGHDLLPY